MKDDKDFALLAVEKNPSCFKHVSDKFKDDKDFSLSSVKINSSCFEHVSDRLKDDKKLALFAVKINPDNFKHISDRLKDDKDIALALIKLNSDYFHLLSDKLKDDNDIAFLATKRNRDNIEHVSDRLKNNQEFILFAMENHLGRVIMHASARLRDDKDFALLAIDRKKDNYNYISERLQLDPEIILQFVKIATEHEDDFFDYMSDKVKDTYGHERSTFIAKVEEKKSLDETLKQFKNEEGSIVDRIGNVFEKMGDLRNKFWPKSNDNKPGNN